MNEDPEEVFCVASAFRKEIAEIDDFDTVLITLKFPSGALGSIDLSREAVYGYGYILWIDKIINNTLDQRMEVHGSNGMVQSHNKQPTSVVLSNRNGISIDTNCYSFPQVWFQFRCGLKLL